MAAFERLAGVLMVLMGIGYVIVADDSTALLSISAGLIIWVLTYSVLSYKRERESGSAS